MVGKFDIVGGVSQKKKINKNVWEILEFRESSSQAVVNPAVIGII